MLIIQYMAYEALLAFVWTNCCRIVEGIRALFACIDIIVTCTNSRLNTGYILYSSKVLFM